MPYFLTVSRTDFAARRRRWKDPSHRSVVRTIGSSELPVAYPGFLLLVDDDGTELARVPLASPKGMLATLDGLLVACFNEIRRFASDLTDSTTFLSEPWCNDLHSLRPSPHGFIAAAAGVDAAFEISPGGAVTWSWWAADHGFTTDSEGRPWSLRKDDDHRPFSYPVEKQLTHLNAVAALNEQTFLATVFQVGALGAVDRRTGDFTPLLTGLGRPHAVRVRDDGLITFANTTAGQVVTARMGPEEVVAGAGAGFQVEQRIDTGTNWLHDAYLHDEGWMLVDGAHSRVIHIDAEGDVVRMDAFNPEWCLYEVFPCKTGGDLA